MIKGSVWARAAALLLAAAWAPASFADELDDAPSTAARTAAAPASASQESVSAVGISGAPGLLRSFSALPEGRRLSLSVSGGAFSGSDFIYAGDRDTFLAGSLGLGYALIENLDGFLSLTGAQNGNTLGAPRSLSSGLDLSLGLRARHGFGPLHVGVVAALLWSSAIDQAKGGSGLGGGAWALASADLRSAGAPILLHANLGYRRDAGSDLLPQRVGALPTFAFSLWQYPVFCLAAAAEVPLGRITPFVEYSLEAPIDSGAPAAATPARISPGLRIALLDGLSALAAVEVGLTRQLWEGVPATPPFLARLALTYTGLDQTPWTVARREPSETSQKAAREPALLVVPPPPAAPAAEARQHRSTGGSLRGKVTDLSGAPLQAVLRLPSSEEHRNKGYDASPEFEISLEPGSYHVEVEAEGYLVQGKRVEIKEGQTQTLNFSLRPVPQVKAAQLTQEQVEIRQSIQFAFNEAKILPESYFILDEVADILLRNPMLKVSVEGHTDDVGSEPFNQGLSEERSFMVLAYLIEKGIDAPRLTSKGFGMSKPLVPNVNDAARAQNRRVEFRIIGK